MANEDFSGVRYLDSLLGKRVLADGAEIGESLRGAIDIVAGPGIAVSGADNENGNSSQVTISSSLGNPEDLSVAEYVIDGGRRSLLRVSGAVDATQTSTIQVASTTDWGNNPMVVTVGCTIRLYETSDGIFRDQTGARGVYMVRNCFEIYTDGTRVLQELGDGIETVMSKGTIGDPPVFDLIVSGTAILLELDHTAGAEDLLASVTVEIDRDLIQDT